MRAAALALAAFLGTAQAQTGPHFIHGSWVNVREAAAATARAVEQLTTNTPVDVTARQGDWCALRYGAGKTGFVACNLLGAKPLTLAEAGKNPARAFWIAPSPNRLAAYGMSLMPPPALRLEELKKTLKYGDTVHFPSVAEFDAAKKLMQFGVKLDPALEVAPRPRVDPLALLKGYQLLPSPIKPSLFLTHQSVALASEQDADGLTAVAGSRVMLTATGLPVVGHGRYDGPEIEWISGFWDVGRAALLFEPAITVYSVASNGLVGAVDLRSLFFNHMSNASRTSVTDASCGARFLNKSEAAATMGLSFISVESSTDMVPRRGYPVLKEGSEVLASLVVPGRVALPPTVKVRVQSQPVQGLKYDDGKPIDDGLLKPVIVLREIDVDGDGVTDVMQVQRPQYAGRISVDIVYRRDWFLNINGQWFDAGAWEDQDCT